jgi:hypothetical protein
MLLPKPVRAGLAAGFVEHPAERAIDRLVFGRQFEEKLLASGREMDLHLPPVSRIRFASREPRRFASRDQCGRAVLCCLQTLRKFTDGRPSTTEKPYTCSSNWYWGWWPAALATSSEARRNFRRSYRNSDIASISYLSGRGRLDELPEFKSVPAVLQAVLRVAGREGCRLSWHSGGGVGVGGGMWFPPPFTSSGNCSGPLAFASSFRRR